MFSQLANHQHYQDHPTNPKGNVASTYKGKLHTTLRLHLHGNNHMSPGPPVTCLNDPQVQDQNSLSPSSQKANKLQTYISPSMNVQTSPQNKQLTLFSQPKCLCPFPPTQQLSQQTNVHRQSKPEYKGTETGNQRSNSFMHKQRVPQIRLLLQSTSGNLRERRGNGLH